MSHAFLLIKRMFEEGLAFIAHMFRNREQHFGDGRQASSASYCSTCIQTLADDAYVRDGSEELNKDYLLAGPDDRTPTCMTAACIDGITIYYQPVEYVYVESRFPQVVDSDSGEWEWPVCMTDKNLVHDDLQGITGGDEKFISEEVFPPYYLNEI